MATYNVTAPDGTQYQVTAPDSASQDQIMSYVQSQHAPANNYDALHAKLSALPADQRSAAVAALSPQDRQTVQSGIQAAAQAAMTPQAQAQAYQQNQAQQVGDMSTLGRLGAAYDKSFMDTGRGIGELVGAISPQDVAQARTQDQALMNTGAGKIGDIAGQVAQTALPGGLIGKGLQGAGVAARVLPYVASAVSGGAFSGAQPVTADESRGRNAAIGTGLGLLGQTIPGALGAAAGKAAPALSPIKQAAMDVAEKYGIPLHLSQVTDSKALQTLASAAKYLPFAGNTAARDAQQGAFNRALSNQIGENAPNLTDEVMQSAGQKIGQGYNDLFARNTVQLQPSTWVKLGQIAKSAKQDLPPDQAQIVTNQIGKFVDAASANNGVIPGRLYQNVRATVQQVEGQNQPSKFLVGQVRKTMQDAANKSMQGDDAQTLANLNGQYNSLKILGKALNRAAGAGGDVSPANLWSLVNGKYGSTPNMRELAQLGQTVLKDQIPDSGTAGRMASYAALTGGAAMPHTVLAPALAGATIGRVLNSPLAARALPYAGQNLLLGMRGLSRPAPYLLPLLAAPQQ